MTILCFSEVLGHERAKNVVARTIKADRVPHAYLFRGPDGVGKKLFAKGLAAALNCKSQTGIACGACSSCKKMASDNHPDYMVVSPEKGAIKIAQVREVSKELAYSPYESQVRVVVLEDVHMMRREAANSLLKTLEEPPENNLLVLTAESSFDVLTTIASRCQVVSFFGLDEVHTQYLIAEKLSGVSEADRKIITRLAGGSPGKGLALAHSDVLSCWESVRELFFGAGSAEDHLLDTLKCAEMMGALKDELPLFLDLLKLWFRDQLMQSVDGSAVSLFDWDEQGRFLAWSSEKLNESINAADQAGKELFFNCNATLVCEVLLFKLLQ